MTASATEGLSARERLDAHVETIVSSDEFRGPSKYRDLLAYLVNRSLADETPHEIDIAVDVFGKDASYDPTESSSVRVYVHQLRKKLHEYYAQHPSGSHIRLSIPKGSYRVSFGGLLSSSDQPPVSSSGLPLRWALGAVTVLLVLSLGANVALLSLSDTSGALRPPAAELAWNSIIEGPEPILIAVGDFFVFTEVGAHLGRTRFVRDVGINSVQDLREFAGDDFGSTVVPSQMKYLPNSVPFALESILAIANSVGKPVSLKAMSDVTGEDLRRNDVIYVGLLRSMGALQEYFFKYSNFSATPPFVELQYNITGDTFAGFGTIDDSSRDYGLFARIPGPGEGEVLIFTGISDMGVQRAVRALTNADSADDVQDYIQANMNGIPSSLEILFEVSGYGRVDLDSRIAVASAMNVSN